ncbi:uncharacterized protein DS421_14g461640 [Arachis hypogaea]|nr:uncharacterized protein DS421_14g461640 [Arachis hypogaea]
MHSSRHPYSPLSKPATRMLSPFFSKSIRSNNREKERQRAMVGEEISHAALPLPSSSPRLTVSRATVAGHLAAVSRSRPVLVTAAHPHHRRLRCPRQATEPASLPRHHVSPSNQPAATTVTEKRRRRGAELESRRRRPWGLELRRCHQQEGEDASWRSKMSPSASVVLVR